MEIVADIISKVGEYLVQQTINQGRYLLCFNSIVEDLKGEENRLKLAQYDINLRVESALENTEIIEKDVKNWLIDVSNILAEVERLKDETEVNKTCLKDWCPNWGGRYRLSRKVEKKTIMMLKLLDNGKFDSVAHRAPLPGIPFLPRKDFELFRSLEYAFNQIIEALKNDGIDLVGLYGMGGAGKTTLAKEVGKKVKEEKIFGEVVMVVVSKTPNFKDIQGYLAESLGLKLEEEVVEERARRLYLRFTESNKKILVILDDVWERFDLKSKLGIPFGKKNKSCKILLTTRKQIVCSAMGCQLRIPLNLLNEDEGLTLLKRHAGIDVDSLISNSVVTEVAKECQGLPLALVTLGSALKEKTNDEWNLVCQKLKNSKLGDIYKVNDAVDVGVHACLKLSYDYLGDEKTKLCFLLCSLFPEDYEIPLESLFRYGMGHGLYPDVDSFEEARAQFRVMVNNLKASFLLLDSDKEEYVEMHNIVRDVALWIASHGKNVFMVRAGMGLTEWPKVEGLEHCTAISLMANNIKVLPNDLFCPKLEILLVEGERFQKTKVSDESFKEIKGLKVLNLNYSDLSLKSFQFLTSLKTLELINCILRNISSLEKLKRLEILSFQHSYLDELPREVGELGNLRLLDLDGCSQLKRIHSNVIRGCSQLEELYIIDSFNVWEVAETSTEESNASLFELNSLSRLARLHLRVDSKFLPKDFAFPKLERYVICVNTYYYGSYRRVLKISKIEATSLIAFQALYQNLEDLYLENIKDVQEVSQLEGLCHSGEEKHVVLSSLTKLVLKNLPQLTCIWKGPTQYLILQNLKSLSIDRCRKMEYIFPISIAATLEKLEALSIVDAYQLKQVFYMDDGSEEYAVARDGKNIAFPKLKKLTLDGLENLVSFYPQNYHSTWPALEEFTINDCSNLGTSFVIEVNMQDLTENLRVLEVGGCNQQLCDGILDCLSHDFKSLEEIRIENSEIKVVFELEQQRLFSLTNLKELRLISLKEVENLYTGSTHILSLQNLNLLEFDGCSKLRYILSPTLARSLLQLKELYVSDCGELEEIIVEDDEEDHLQPLLFPNLLSINVERCNKLKRVFPIIIARGLQQLKIIHLQDNSQLEEVFGDRVRDGADVVDDKAIVLPQLQYLYLKELPSLTNFSIYHFIFPSLKDGKLHVVECRKVATRFSWDEKERSVHAEGKPPKNDDQEATTDMVYFGSYELPGKLPPYVEKFK